MVHIGFRMVLFDCKIAVSKRRGCSYRSLKLLALQLSIRTLSLHYGSSFSVNPGKLSDEQKACWFGSLNCEQGLDDTISIPKNITINTTKDKKPNVCMMASSLFDDFAT
jgi:hypothetical protein